jgi:TrmH family RNA methyltransferase
VISRAQLKHLRALRLKKVREREGVLLVEGLHLVEEAVARGLARAVFLTGECARGGWGRRLAGGRAPVTEIEPREAEALAETETPQGAFAVVEDPVRPLEAASVARDGVVLVAAGVADPGNLGTLVRTAAALGAAAVVVTAGTVEPTNPKAVRASAGALFRVPVLRGEIRALKDAGFRVLVADARGKPVSSMRVRAPRTALVVGNEPHGVDAWTRGLADAIVGVPIAEGVDSLNVAVAAGILLFALRALPVPR